METLIEVDWQGYVTLGRGLRGGETFVKDAERRIRNVEREITVATSKAGLGHRRLISRRLNRELRRGLGRLMLH